MDGVWLSELGGRWGVWKGREGMVEGLGGGVGEEVRGRWVEPLEGRLDWIGGRGIMVARKREDWVVRDLC